MVEQIQKRLKYHLICTRQGLRQAQDRETSPSHGVRKARQECCSPTGHGWPRHEKEEPQVHLSPAADLRGHLLPSPSLRFPPWSVCSQDLHVVFKDRKKPDSDSPALRQSPVSLEVPSHEVPWVLPFLHFSAPGTPPQVRPHIAASCLFFPSFTTQGPPSTLQSPIQGFPDHPAPSPCCLVHFTLAT